MIKEACVVLFAMSCGSMAAAGSGSTGSSGSGGGAPTPMSELPNYKESFVALTLLLFILFGIPLLMAAAISPQGRGVMRWLNRTFKR